MAGSIYDDDYIAIPEAKEKTFLRQTQESSEWYSIFKIYYLGCPKPRSLFAAYKLFLKNEQKENTDEIDDDSIKLPEDWRNAFIYFNWPKRSEDWDLFLSDLTVEKYKQRYDDLRETEFNLWEKTVQIAEIGLEGLLKKLTTAKDDGKDFSLKPFDLERILRVGNDLARRSVERTDMDRSNDMREKGVTVNTINIIENIKDRQLELNERLLIASQIHETDVIEVEVDNGNN